MITMRQDAELGSRGTILFDFDGTLADTKPAIVRTAGKVLKDWGLDPALVDERVGELVGPPFPEAFTLVFGLPHEDAEEVTRRYRAIYTKLGAQAWPLFGQVRALLTHLRDAGKVVAVASSKPDWLVRVCIADNDASDLFDLVVGGIPGEVETKAQAITRVMELLGAPADACVMVGDRFHDVEGAAEAGIPCIGVTWGGTGTREELIDAGAIAVVDEVPELEKLLL